VRLEWLPPLRRMTRSARELQRARAGVKPEEKGASAAIWQCASGGVALWEAARDLVKLCRYPRPLLRDLQLQPDELTELLLAFAEDVEARARLVRTWQSS
jgi:hypothetical protein